MKPQGTSLDDGVWEITSGTVGCPQKKLVWFEGCTLKLGQSTADYLNDFETDLEVAGSYATEHGKRQQQRYVSRYNLRSREKQFHVGNQVLILISDSTASKVFSRWQGQATAREIRPRNSYLVELNGVCQHLHTDKLGQYEISVGEVIVTPADCGNIMAELSTHQCAIVYKSDHNFGDFSGIGSTEPQCKLFPSQKIDPSKRQF